ncbi:WRKY transcription factor 44-like isoform X2 [Diospyros lotus]|uniref:WRKY transcription factor 44-like isoform X2 n=1 Tax=Diospyros lotus TaxID=55363 RepID=UPI002256A349|nr:WRKY transcription factor 44-like isoform X2 [Diospyros lotus]
MEIKDAERTVIAKPVASRPTCSSFSSFSNLLSGTINSSPSSACSETAVTAIRPKTLRFKPVANQASVEAEVCAADVCYPSDKLDKVLYSDSKDTLDHKPLAEVATKKTFSSLQNTKFSLQPDREKITNASKMSVENMEQDRTSLPLTGNGDRPPSDGYNWRKYGQKQVKGSEYPRSYYKCTHPTCPVKKKLERLLDGQIAEIVYQGEHNHAKPSPPKRHTSGRQGQGFVSGETNNPSCINQLNYRNDLGLRTHSTYSSKAPLAYEPVLAGALNTAVRTPENYSGVTGDCEEGSKLWEAEDDEPKCKRRKNENEPDISGGGVQQPCAVVQSSKESEIVGDDGFCWIKYRQKVMKGYPYPREFDNHSHAESTTDAQM